VTDPDHRSDPDGGDSADRTQRQRMLAGDLYLADDPELVADHRRVMQLLEAYNGNLAEGAAARGLLLNELFAAFGAGSDIRPPLYCDYGYNVRVGDRTFANFGLVVLDVAPIVIGDDVQIGPNVQLLTATHPVEAAARLAKWESGRPITIADNVWLGGGSIVLAGVTIGANSVIGAGAVVTRDIPPDTVAVGNPARAIRHLRGDPRPNPAVT
jgi:maltose O-acetyltransferase